MNTKISVAQLVKMQVLKIFLVDDIGSCGRVSCECDMAFVSDLSRVYFHQDHSNGQIKNTGMILKSFSSKVIQMLCSYITYIIKSDLPNGVFWLVFKILLRI